MRKQEYSHTSLENVLDERIYINIAHIVPFGYCGYQLIAQDKRDYHTDVSFPQDGPNSNSGITRTGDSSFILASIGAYQVNFQVGITEAGQLLLTLNGADLEYTVVGRATGTSQIIGMCIVETDSVNSILTVRNPAGNATALTVTPLGGGTRPVSAHLTIIQIGYL